MSALCQYQTLPDIIRSLVSGTKSVVGDAVLAAAIAARYCFLWRVGLVGSGRPLDSHNAQSRIEVYVDVQDQAVRPSGECGKVRHGFCRYGYTAFNLNSHVVAVAEKKLFHILHCVGGVSHVSSPRNSREEYTCSQNSYRAKSLVPDFRERRDWHRSQPGREEISCAVRRPA
jgi:hypothetical protein